MRRVQVGKWPHAAAQMGGAGGIFRPQSSVLGEGMVKDERCWVGGGENMRNVGGRVGTGEITAISQAPAVLRLAGHFLQRAWTLLLLLLDFAAYF